MAKHRILLSVIVATKDRPDKIVPCIHSILCKSNPNFELLVIDQSKGTETRELAESIKDKRLQYIRIETVGKSRALNHGISLARGDIIVFTDDDCIVGRHWMRDIARQLTIHKDVVAVFGKTLPYQKSKHPNEVCPCVFTKHGRTQITKTPCAHDKYIGFGNNMAIRKPAFTNIGGFKTWLGPGSIGSNAEDAEMALRLLTNGHSVLYSPDMIVHHNKWLSADAMKVQNLSYILGETACYGFFYFKGHKFASPVITQNIRESVSDVKTCLKRFIFLQWRTQLLIDTLHIVRIAANKFKGLTLGFFYANVENIVNAFDR